MPDIPNTHPGDLLDVNEPTVDFVGIGVQKAATTWIFQCLEEHPGIETASIANNKELNFFSTRYGMGYFWYHEMFEFHPSCVAGEYSVTYFFDRNVPERLYRYNPDLQLLISLRNPIDRAYSQHIHDYRSNRLSSEFHSFKEALKQKPLYLEQGYYATHLRRFLNWFPRDQIHIMFYEDIQKHPESVVETLYRFLGLSTSFRPSRLTTKVNVAHTYRSDLLHRCIRTTSDTIRRILGTKAVQWIKRTGIPGLIRNWNEKKGDKIDVPAMSKEVRARLRNHFQDEISELETLMDRDFSHWN